VEKWRLEHPHDTPPFPIHAVTNFRPSLDKPSPVAMLKCQPYAQPKPIWSSGTFRASCLPEAPDPLRPPNHPLHARLHGAFYSERTHRSSPSKVPIESRCMDARLGHEHRRPNAPARTGRLTESKAVSQLIAVMERTRLWSPREHLPLTRPPSLRCRSGAVLPLLSHLL